MGLVVAATIAVWAAAGPLRAGWAARAGTPVELLASQSAAATLPARPFVLPLRGSVESQIGADGDATVRVDGLLGATSARIRLVLVGAVTGGAITPTRIGVTYGTVSKPDLYTSEGRLDGSDTIVADVARGSQTLELTISLRLDPASGTSGGSVGAARVA